MLSNKALQPEETQVSAVRQNTLVVVTDSKMNLCRVNTVVLLHVLKASEAAATACSNSALVVSGTRVRSVCVDCYNGISGQNK
jgi:hypothetical protein